MRVVCPRNPSKGFAVPCTQTSPRNVLTRTAVHPVRLIAAKQMAP